jgi:AcrR family transcriptional regulator
MRRWFLRLTICSVHQMPTPRAPLQPSPSASAGVPGDRGAQPQAACARPLRRDAERNRRLILHAAGELFAERGLAVTLDDVAARAGLGVGTVYRRFSSRDDLVDALFEQRMLEVLALADEALATEDAWEGLCSFLRRAAELQAADRGLHEVLLGSTDGRERVARIREQMRPRGEEIVRRAQASGALRDDFDISDIPLLHMMLGDIAGIGGPERPDLWRRFLELMLDGMRAQPGRAALTVRPLGLDRLDDAMCRWRPSGRFSG